MAAMTSGAFAKLLNDNLAVVYGSAYNNNINTNFGSSLFEPNEAQALIAMLEELDADHP